MGCAILVVGPGEELGELARCFRSAGDECDVAQVVSAAEILERLRGGEPCDLVVVDYFLGDGKLSGTEIIREARALDGELPIVAVAEKGDVESAAAAVEAGAIDFLVRGGRLQERVSTLMGKVRKLLRLVEGNRLLREQNRLLQEADRARYRIVGESPQIIELIERIRRVASVPRPVLVLGERGTGKELIARAIHAAGGEPERPIVTVNCAAFTDTLLESELFGHEKGAFTGADDQVRGKFELAAGGTLFLDEIGNMSLSFQQKILRVVEYGCFVRVGGTAEIHTDARIIAATNVDLKERIRDGVFLQDLYDRLAFEIIHAPPLRGREGDTEVLARHFLNEFMREIPAFRGKRLSDSAVQVLGRYDFPGNVRELKNIIERAAYRDTTNEITPEDIGMLEKPQLHVEGGNFKEKLDAFGRGLVTDALERSGGNQAEAARKLGLSYYQFRYYYQKYSGAQ